jgi:predicted Fe-Mo cluster-binding NifX family protein
MDAAIDPRFGRCRYLLVVDAERETFEALENLNATAGNAAGQAVQRIAAKGAKVLLTGDCGSNAAKALAAAGIQVVPGCSGTVREVVRQFRTGQRPPAGKAKAAPDSASGKEPAPGGRP